MQPPVIELSYYSQYADYSCHRCQSPIGRSRCYFTTGIVTPAEHYNLVNRGWSRYDNYYYKQGISPTCCRDYATRIDVSKYRIRRSHQKIVRRWNQFFSDDTDREAYILERQLEGISGCKEKDIDVVSTNDGALKRGIIQNQVETKEIILREGLKDLIDFLKLNSSELCDRLSWKDMTNSFAIGDDVERKSKILKRDTKRHRVFITNILLRLFQDNKAALEQNNLHRIDEFIRRIESLVIERLQNIPLDLKIDVQEDGYIKFLVAKEVITAKFPNLKVSSTGSLRGEEVVANYFAEGLLNFTSKRLNIEVVKSQFEEESYQLYKKFQKSIHQNETDRSSYMNFLCTQNMRYEQIESNGRTLHLGCYHMKYYLDTKLIAVGVLEVMPQLMNSRQFFYDPDYRKLSIAIIGAQMEVKYVQMMQKFFPKFKYYSLDCYNPNYEKMLYKASYEPMEVLCPTTYRWITFDQETKKKVHKLETTLANEDEKITEDMDFSVIDMDSFVEELTVFKKDMVTKIDFKVNSQIVSESDFKSIVKDIGRELSRSVIFRIDI